MKHKVNPYVSAIGLALMVILVASIILGCSVETKASQDLPLKIWKHNDNGAYHTFCVEDYDTGVNYVVVSTERGNGEYSIAITPRLNADGSLYVG